MPAQRNIAAGNNYSFIGFIDSKGLMVGASTSAPAAGSASGMIRLLGIQNVPSAIPTPDTVQVPGDDDVMGEFDFNPTASRAYDATFSVNDETLASLLLGVNVETAGGMRMYEDDIKDVPDVQCMVIHQGRAKSQDSGTKGVPGYEAYVYHSATVRFLGRQQLNIREPAVYRVRITPQLVTKTFDGLTINASTQGTEASRRKHIASDYPIHAVAFTCNGSALAVPLDYTPISTATCYYRFETALGSGSYGTPQTFASVSVSAKTATLNAAHTSGLQGIAVYQFAP